MSEIELKDIAYEHEAASRFDQKYKYEKCPKCLMMSQNFMKFGEYFLACSTCGTTFVPKMARDDFKANLHNILKRQEQDKSGWVCEKCQFKAKTKAGLTAHMRSCGKDK